MKAIKNLSLRYKMLGAMLLASFIGISLISFITYGNMKGTLTQQVKERFAGLKNAKAGQLTNLFKFYEGQVETFSESKSVIQAMEQFKASYYQVPDKNGWDEKVADQLTADLEAYYSTEFSPRLEKNSHRKIDVSTLIPQTAVGKTLQSLYITGNRNGVGEKDRLNKSIDDKSKYSEVHNEYHPIFRKYLKKFGYYDIFLIDDKTGEIVYSVFKETDFATNLMTGPHSKSALAEAFLKARTAGANDLVGASTFQEYIPSYDNPAAFISSPIFKEGERIGVIAMQIPVDQVDEVMTYGGKWKENGLGNTGEFYLVGPDKKLRSESRHVIEEMEHLIEELTHLNTDKGAIELIRKRSSAVLIQEMNTQAVEEALIKRKSDDKILPNFHGEPVLTSYAPIKVLGMDWAIVGEIDEAEAFVQIESLRNEVLAYSLVVLLFVILLAVFFANTLIKPLVRATEVAEKFTKGDLDARIVVTSNDEIGNLGKTLNQTFESQVIAKEEADLAKKEAEEAAAKANSSMEGSLTAFITCDRDLVITYVNPAADKMFKEHAKEIQSVLPEFEPSTLVGTSIDTFHKVPSVQRGILSKTTNLPYTAQIKVATLSFKLNVSAMKDSKGNYVGNTLEWRNVTSEVKKQKDVARMSSMVEGSSVALMVCDRDLKITYMNPTVINLLQRHEGRLRTVLPKFDVKNLIGQSINDYHIHPEKQQSILANTSLSPYRTDINVAGLSFGLNAIALYDDEGNHIGTAVEWNDNNARENYRNEVNKIITSAANGQLSVRGDVSKMDAIYAPMLSGINDVIEAVVNPIVEIQSKLSRVSDGDLTAYVQGEYKGDYASLKMAVNGTLDSLNDILGQVQGAGGQIGTGARELSSSSQTVSQGATESAASLEEITASMTEMAEQTRQNADNASQANKLAATARDSAENGNTQMRKMVNAMADISESSQSISKIIKVIDEIAFQTNLLALNAAVEAARAGVHGKGFAVVAEEVRNLAARSAKAAKETTDMIESSIMKVTTGSEIASKTQEALEEIVNVVSKATDLVSEINAASNEQALGISQVNQGLSQLDAVTQQNSAAAEQSASASEELAGQSLQLQEMLKRFKLNNSSSAGMHYGSVPDFGAHASFSSAPKLPGASLPNTSSVNPEDIISLDDDEFGKF